jgi:hypothetical protein
MTSSELWVVWRFRSVSFIFNRSRELMYIRPLWPLVLRLLSIDDLSLLTEGLGGPASMLMVPKLTIDWFEWVECSDAELPLFRPM